MRSADAWLPWLWTALVPESGPGSGGAKGVDPGPFATTCPHCTNIDTLSRHCRSRRCGWVMCTCGALVYSRRRHRHPRHGSDRDTCHDPAAAA